jgi:hypothetical protein
MTSRPLALTAVLVTAACAGRTPAPAAPRTAVAPAVPATAPVAATLAYVTGSARYRVEQTVHVTQEMMGQVTNIDLTSRQLFSVVGTMVAPNISFAVTLDSLEMTGPAGVDLSSIAAARGQTFRLVMAPSGLTVSTTAPDSTNPIMRQLSSGLSDLMPRLPTPPIAAGQTWSDTVTRSAGDMGTSTRFRQHQVVGWEDRDGARALHLTTTTNYTVSGSTEAQGQAVEFRGSGVSTRDSFISAAGVYLGGAERDSSLVNANVTAMGLVIPVHQTRRSTTTRLP